jgi:hypothetical protein
MFRERFCEGVIARRRERDLRMSETRGGTCIPVRNGLRETLPRSALHGAEG